MLECKDRLMLKYRNKEHTGASFTDVNGAVWSGISVLNGKIQGDGQIPEQAKEWLADGNTIEPYVSPSKPFATLSRPAFLFMAKKLGLTSDAIKTFIGKLPSTTQEEIDAKALALLVFENQQTFKRTNPLLAKLVALSPLTDAQVDTAWRIGEQLKW